MRLLPAASLAATLVTLASATGAAHASDWVIDPETSAVTFTLSAFNKEETGQFETFGADISLNPEDLSTASIRATIETGSVSISNGQYTSAMRGSAGLGVSDHGEAVFVSEQVEATETGYAATGTLTIKGQTQPSVLNFTLEITGDRAVAEGQLSITRGEFEIGESSWSDVSEMVEVQVKIEADRAQ